MSIIIIQLTDVSDTLDSTDHSLLKVLSSRDTKLSWFLFYYSFQASFAGSNL